MKKEGHPPYQDVLYVDTATGTKFVCGTTLQPKETEMFEGKEYPVFRVPISSASHPFFTGSQQFVDSEGRVDKFRKRYTAKPASPAKKEGDSEKKEEKTVAVKKKPAAKKAVAKAPAKKAEIKEKP
ncbi:MAG TPA: type B 50S ribosomal protein L31 [Chlamydiales bacterium]|nr:type B 50S ribosomal protein L31 [Chlamydiales bacterium]HPE84909.1 type B 50S ribosomal protein L31 [Chlamydiales bacterium]